MCCALCDISEGWVLQCYSKTKKHGMEYSHFCGAAEVATGDSSSFLHREFTPNRTLKNTQEDKSVSICLTATGLAFETEVVCSCTSTSTHTDTHSGRGWKRRCSKGSVPGEALHRLCSRWLPDPDPDLWVWFPKPYLRNSNDRRECRKKTFFTLKRAFFYFFKHHRIE